jgi:glycosyltransferase involved in cell wall biosynthesis
VKITILYKFRDASWGGANQFLKALRNYFRRLDCYVDDAEIADVLLFISYPFNSERFFTLVKKIKKKKNVIVVNRMNGPISLYRDRDVEVDKINFTFNHDVADGTIYQSEWSRLQCYGLGMKPNEFETVIMNSPDPDVFYPLTKHKEISPGRKIKLIAVSWSRNPKKGFDVYKYLDENLDFNHYEMSFVGNSHVKFKNIKHIPPLHSEGLAHKLRNHDILIFASKIETCSNSLLEALHCGLPVVARNNSSQPEIVGKGGKLFEGKEDILSAIDSVASDIDYYRKSIDVSDILEVGMLYYNFCRDIYQNAKKGSYIPKKWNYKHYCKLMSNVYWWKHGLGIKQKLLRVIQNDR